MSSENEIVRDDYGFDSNGIHTNGTPYCNNGFDAVGIHRLTGTVFAPSGWTRGNERYDEEGYDALGYDEEGFDREGYDRNGYDEDGEDRYGNTPCDNGECENWDCSCHEESDFSDHLRDYSTDVCDELGWSPHRKGYLYAGLEIEMYSRQSDTDDVDLVLRQIGREYAKCRPLTSTHQAAIATSDSSLTYQSSGGFEVKTVPLTRPQMHYIFSRIDVLGNGRCRAWFCGPNTGMHIHVSRDALTDLTIGKLGVFVNDPFNAAFIEHVSGRGATYNSFQPAKTIKCRSTYHSSMLNTSNSDTIEFRMFRSNLRGKGILKNYEFVMSSIAFCNSIDMRRASTDWHSYLRWMSVNYAAYPHMHAFLKHPSQVADQYLPLLPKNARRTDGTGNDAA